MADSFFPILFFFCVGGGGGGGEGGGGPTNAKELIIWKVLSRLVRTRHFNSISLHMVIYM